MNILVVGGGAREHAICEAVLQSDKTKLYSVMKNLNPGIQKIAKKYAIIQETDIKNVVKYATKQNIDLVLIGPEAPLEKGLTDALLKNQIPVCSPTQKAAQIETNKAWMRRLLRKHEIPGQLEFEIFSDREDAREYINLLDGQIAIKPLGLTGGKGVRVSGDHFTTITEALDYISAIIANKIGGNDQVLIEEKAIGEEFTLQALSDGNNICVFPAVQDHKRLLPNDEGPNTGGMGSYSCEDALLPFLTQDDYDQAAYTLLRIIRALKKENCPYIGPIYGQFMLTSKGVKIIEINARFGDPEAMNVLPLLQSNYTQLCLAMLNESLPEHHLEMRKQATVCKYVVPEGYGYQSKTNKPIYVDEKAIQQTGAQLFYASVNKKMDTIYTTSSRALAVVGIDNTLSAAEQMAERALSHVKSDYIFIRHDVGTQQLIDKRVNHMKILRPVL